MREASEEDMRDLLLILMGDMCEGEERSDELKLFS